MCSLSHRAVVPQQNLRLWPEGRLKWEELGRQRTGQLRCGLSRHSPGKSSTFCCRSSRQSCGVLGMVTTERLKGTSERCQARCWASVPRIDSAQHIGVLINAAIAWRVVLCLLTSEKHPAVHTYYVCTLKDDPGLRAAKAWPLMGQRSRTMAYFVCQTQTPNLCLGLRLADLQLDSITCVTREGHLLRCSPHGVTRARHASMLPRYLHQGTCMGK